MHWKWYYASVSERDNKEDESQRLCNHQARVTPMLQAWPKTALQVQAAVGDT